jgi:hypothetical protein
MKDTLKITVEYLYDDLDLEVRTGALYALYGLYFHQMSMPRTKIQVTPNQWISILEFISIMNQRSVQEPEYVFRRLLHSDAFEFCTEIELVRI